MRFSWNRSKGGDRTRMNVSIISNGDGVTISEDMTPDMIRGYANELLAVADAVEKRLNREYTGRLIVSLVRSDQKVEAIKELRNMIGGLGLLEAKEIVEMMSDLRWGKS
jgi:GTP1/Obg family GTP-binding protein